MARKKKQTYNKMVQMMEDLQKAVGEERDRLAGILASALDHDTALLLGDLSDAELRRTAALMLDHIGMFVNLVRLNRPESKRFQDAEDGPKVEGDVRYNQDENCFEVWDTEANQLVGRLHDGMCLELREIGGEAWVPVEIRLAILDTWFMVENGSPRKIFDGLRVRFHKSKA